MKSAFLLAVLVLGGCSKPKPATVGDSTEIRLWNLEERMNAVEHSAKNEHQIVNALWLSAVSRKTAVSQPVKRAKKLPLVGSYPAMIITPTTFACYAPDVVFLVNEEPKCAPIATLFRNRPLEATYDGPATFMR